MNRFGLWVFFIMVFVMHCAEEEEPFFSHLSGWVRKEADSTGVNDLVLQIRDINPDHLNQFRERTTTTMIQDSLDGYFEMDSVLYGTSQKQGTGYVAIIADSLYNEDWPSHIWFPNIASDIATVTLYISKD